MHYAAECVAQHGMEFWTAEQLNRWERARRSLRWDRCTAAAEGTTVTLSVPTGLNAVTILWLAATPGNVTLDDRELTPRTVERWGCAFQAVTFDLEADISYTLRYETAASTGRDA
jgi:hypothetical protein